MPGAWLTGGESAIAAALAAASVLLWVVIRPRDVVQHPWSVLLATALLCGLAGSVLVDLESGELRLRIDASTEPLLPRGDPAQDLYRSAVRDFGDDEVFVVAVECPEVFTVSCLEGMDGVSRQIALLEGVRSVRSLLDVTSFRYVAAEDWIEVRPFIEEIPHDPAELARLRARALADPVYRRSLVAEDAGAAALNISFHKMSDDEFIASGLDRQITQILQSSSAPDQRYYVAGRPHVKQRVYYGLIGDLRVLIPASVAVVGLVLWLVTGVRRGVALPLGAALVANLWTFAAIAFVGRSLTLLTGLLAPMLLAIGAVYGVHLLARYQEEAELHDSVQETVLATLRHMLSPVLIAGLTTVIGFGALLVTDVPAVFELGAFSMFGIGSITVLTLTALPAALALMKQRPQPERAVDLALDAALGRLARALRRRPGTTLALSACAVAIAIALIPRIVIDTDYLSYLDESDPVRIDFEEVNRLLAGAVPLYVVLDGAEESQFREPAVLHAIERLQARFDQVPGVSRSQSFVDTLRTLNRAFHADDPEKERVPDTRPGVSELLFMIPKTELTRFVTVNHGRANVIVRTGEVGSAAIQGLVTRLEAQIAAEPPPPGIKIRVTGNAILLARSADGIARSQPLSVGIAALAIFLLISAGLRSLRLGLVAMVPNVVPVLVFFGLLGAGAAPLSLPTSLIGSVALGIAIDDTVHFLVRYRAERRRGLDPAEAVEQCSRRVGRPIVTTTVMLFLGFGVIAFSEFASLQEFGILSAVTMVICLVTDLVLLPALLIRTRV